MGAYNGALWVLPGVGYVIGGELDGARVERGEECFAEGEL